MTIPAFVPPTLRELVEVGMPKNIADCEWDEKRSARELSGMTPTDSRRTQAMNDIQRFKFDRKHFESRLLWWGNLLHAYPSYADRPACDVLHARGPAVLRPVKLPPRSFIEPREPGEDDLDLPF